MYDLTRFTLRDTTVCDAALRQLGAGASSMEDVANRTVRYLYDQFVNTQTGERVFALVRFFKTHRYTDLEPPLQEFARRRLGDTVIPPDLRCLVLLATAGDQPGWNRRQDSVGHQAIPLPSPEMVEAFPLGDQLIKRLGLDGAQVVQPQPELLQELEQRMYNVFYVPRALGSRTLVAQKAFVIPYGIESAVEFGAILPLERPLRGDHVLEGPIPRETADLFAPLVLSVKLAVLPFDGGVVFATQHPDEVIKRARH